MQYIVTYDNLGTLERIKKIPFQTTVYQSKVLNLIVLDASYQYKQVKEELSGIKGVMSITYPKRPILSNKQYMYRF